MPLRSEPAAGATRPPFLLLPRHIALETSDLGRARDHLGGIFAPHRLDLAGRTRDLAFRHAHVPFGALSFNLLQYGADVTVRAPALEDFYLLQLTLAGHCALREAGTGRRTVLAPGTLSVSNPTRAYTKRWSADSRQLLVRIERRAVERLVAERTGGEHAPDFAVAPVAIGAGTRSLVRLIEAVCADLEDEASAFAAPAVRRQLQRSLIALLLETMPHDCADMLACAVPSAVPAVVRRAEAFIREHAAAPIGLAEIARAAGASARSLQAGFRRVRGTTPTGYLRAVRLDHARRDLAAGNGIGVTDVALANGFNHPGKFALAYKARFGEAPSATWRRRT